MCETGVFRRRATCCALLLWLLALCPASSHGQNIVAVKQMRPDKACGPRCLLALMKVTGHGRQDCDLKCIYGLIGKEPLRPTSLRDLKEAATDLGFSAKGYKLSLPELRQMDGYAILAIGLAPGTRQAPLHFILVKRLTESHAILVDPKTLNSVAVPLGDLDPVWSGYALILKSQDDAIPLPKPPDDPNLTVTGSHPPDQIDQMWDFGIVDDGSLLEHTFVVYAADEEPCKIELLGKSCTCVDALLGCDTAGNRTLTMKLRVKQPAWQQASAKVAFDPPGVTRTYAVKAFGRATFVMEPREGYVEVTSDEAVQYPIRVIYHTDVNDFAAFNRVTTGDFSNMTVGDVQTERVVSDRGGEKTVAYIFDVPLVCQAQAKSGAVQVTHGSVGFMFDTAAGEKLVPLKLTIRTGTERVHVFPEKVFLMVSKADGKASRKVKLEFVKEPYPTDLTVHVDDTLPVEIKCKRLCDNAYLADVVVSSVKIGNVSLGKQSGTAVFKPEGDQAAIELPISIFVRD